VLELGHLRVDDRAQEEAEAVEEAGVWLGRGHDEVVVGVKKLFDVQGHPRCVLPGGGRRR
jgi:hypothetical protein